jgi:hypothetical protein
MCERYVDEGHSVVFLRLPLLEAVALNDGRGPELCKYNSGGARQNDGNPIPRGPDTFVLPHLAEFGRAEVREVVFHNFVELPPSTQYCEGAWEGPWLDF